MVQFLLNRINKRYVKKRQRTKIGELAGILGLISNLLLFIGKFLIGFTAGSVSIMADAMNSLSDFIASILTLIGFRVGAKPADSAHPFGHERFEYISGLVISLIITFVGFQFLTSSVSKMIQPEPVRISKYLFIVLVLSVLIKIWQGRIYLKLAKNIDSETLKASSKDSFNDVYTTLAVLFSALFEWYTGVLIDGYVGFLLALYIIYSGFSMVQDFVRELLGSRPNQEEIQEMEARLSSYSNILSYHDLLVHNYGPRKRFASVHIEVDSSWTLMQAHQVIDTIEKDFQEQLGVDLVCHLDPVAIQDIHYLTIANTMNSIIFHIDQCLKIHDFRVIDKTLQFDLVIPEAFSLSEKELRRSIQKAVLDTLGEYKLDITFDHNYLL
jgi:cation diffusion facilitator family transporter